MTQPEVYPRITSALIDSIEEANRERGPKPTALGTKLRGSWAGDCARKLSFLVAGVPETDPMDLAGQWVTWIGTQIHEHLQDAVVKRFPDAEVEKVAHIPSIDLSGSADIFLVVDDARTLYELKTVNGTAFSQATGVDKRGYKRSEAKGPRIRAKLQASLYAHAFDCDEIVIGYIALEAISKQLAERVGLSEYDRFLAEWRYTRDEWEPWAADEIERLRWILDVVESGRLTERFAIDDDGEEFTADPEASRGWWGCRYCSHREACLDAGPGVVKLVKP